MGFRGFELGVSRAPFRLKNALALADKHSTRFCSLHNICSENRIDPENLRGHWLSSFDEEKRRIAVDSTLESARLGKELGVSAVVLHLGPVIELQGRSLQRKLFAAASSGNAAFADKLLKQRAELAPRVQESACRSLSEICDKIDDVALCIENPYFFYEIPRPDELSAIFDRVDAANLFHWHDFGHAHVLHLLGVADRTEWFERFQQRIYGAHIHDASGLCDHKPPGYGEIDLRSLLSRLPERALRVIEVSGEFSADDVRSGLRLLQKL